MKKIKNWTKNSSGITLIALVITIIVLLILAGVSLSLIMGNDGILGRAENAVTEHTNASIEEEVELALAELKMEYYDEKYVKGTPGLGEYADYASKKLKAGINTSNGTLVLASDGTSLSYKNSDNVELAKGEFNAETGGVTIAGVATGGAGNSNTIPDGMYSVAGITEDDIAPQELFEYEIVEGTARITKMNDDYVVSEDDNYYKINHPSITDTLVVPYEIIEGENSYPVTEVELTTYTNLKKDEFATLSGKLPGVKTLIYPNTVTKISAKKWGEYVGDEWHGFGNAGLLEEVIFSNKLQEIPSPIFENETKLRNITIPGSVTKIDVYAFIGCTSLTNITVDKDNPKYDSRENCNAIIETESNKLILGCKNTEIPSSVTSIESSAFKDCTGLTSIEIPSSVTSIGGSAFDGCSGLTSITIEEGVTSIGTDAFRECAGLTSVIIPNSVTTLGAFVFSECTGLTKIYIPSTVKTIPVCNPGFFSGCSSTCQIYTGATAQQSGWGTYWNYYDSGKTLTVNYGKSLDDFRNAQ